MSVVVRSSVGRRKFLHWEARGDGGILNTDKERRISGERSTLGSELQGRRILFGMLFQRYGTPELVNDHVRVHTGRSKMA